MIFTREFRQIPPVGIRGGQTRHRQALRGGSEDALAARGSVFNELTRIAEEQIGTARHNEARLLPEDRIASIAISSITGHEIDGDDVVIGGGRKFESELLLLGQRI